MSGASNGAKDIHPFDEQVTTPESNGIPPGHKIDPKTGKIIQKGVGKEYIPWVM